MNESLRKLFPYLMLVTVLASVAYAISFGTLPPADFSFNNEDEVKTVDPSKAKGVPEHRIVTALFEGLLRQMPVKDAQPDENGIVPMEPAPGVAELPDVSADLKTYTFKLRPNAHWSNGDPVTAHDFLWAWRRTLHPETGSEYAYQLYYIVGAKKYNTGELEPGDRVEVELPDREDELQPFPRGTIQRGVLKEIIKPQRPDPPAKATKEQLEKLEANWIRRWTYVVDLKPSASAQPNWDAVGTLTSYSQEPDLSTNLGTAKVQKCLHVLADFESVFGAKALDDRTLVVQLNSPTPFFSELVAFYTLFPVHRGCVEKHGSPQWTKAENLVCNGPFTLQFRRLRDRIRLVKNPQYWDAEHIALNTIDGMAIKSETTALSMFLKGQLDWTTKPPNTAIPRLKIRDDYLAAPALITYFYRLNVARKPFDDPRVRRALNMALDKQLICDFVTKAGQKPATSLVPPGIKGYRAGQCGEFDVAAAKKLLADAGFPGGQGFPKVQILYNTNESHRDIAEVIQQQWRNNLGIEIELRNLEWGVYLDSISKTDFDIARAGWVGDYPDPNTFLDMFVTNGAQNNTNWSSPKYDQLIATAAAESDPTKRLDALHQAEQILMDELPIIPIYFYVSINMVHPRVKNFFPNIQDVHPLHIIHVER